ncbi:MAG: hypothetical protein U0527_09865 [Candidatus Eisenbacteria bacterium]
MGSTAIRAACARMMALLVPETRKPSASASTRSAPPRVDGTWTVDQLAPPSVVSSTGVVGEIVLTVQ